MILTNSSSRNCKMSFIIGRGFAERQILKKWELPYILNWVEYFDKLLRKHCYWQDLAQEIANWHVLSVETLPSSKFWKKGKMALSLEQWRILWWNFAYTLILTRCSQWDCQMTFGIGRGFEEVQILKKNETGPISWTSWYILIKNMHTHYYWHAVPSSKFWKSENGRTEWTIVMKLCIRIDIDKM